LQTEIKDTLLLTSLEYACIELKSLTVVINTVYVMI